MRIQSDFSKCKSDPTLKQRATVMVRVEMAWLGLTFLQLGPPMARKHFYVIYPTSAEPCFFLAKRGFIKTIYLLECNDFSVAR